MFLLQAFFYVILTVLFCRCIIIFMENYIIGNILKEYRVRRNVSQEDLCLDLCAVSTLSRIESGLQIPGRKLLEALFSRLGLNRSIPITKADFQRESFEYKIIDMSAAGNFNFLGLLDEYRICGDKLTPLEEQFYLFYKTMAEDFFNHDSKKALEKYEEALKISIKDYKLGKLPSARLLTKTELLILNNISRTQYFLGEKEDAIELMEFLRAYFESGIMSEEEKAKNYPVILFNLENWYGMQDNDEKVIELCNIGIDVCIRYGKLSIFPYQIFNKGCSLIKLGKVEEGKDCITDSFVVLKLLKKFDDIEYAKKWLKANLHVDF